MILSQVNYYLRERRRASIADMALGLGATPDALRDMLAILERKGRVRRLPSGTPCGGGCSKCDPAGIELYEWTDQRSAEVAYRHD
jgi:predicted ArsR family transcriptional regulator